MKSKNDYYILYKAEGEEALYAIAQKYDTCVPKILTANPRLNPFMPDLSSTLVIPINRRIIDESKNYDHDCLKNDLMLLKSCYPFLDIDIIGLSVEGREIFSVCFGRGEHIVIYNGAHHGNEWITTVLLMKWVEEMCEAYALNACVKGYEIQRIFQNTRIIIVPMINPDGVELVINGFKNIKTNQNKLLKMNRYNSDFSQWKANINGVDLNRNYPAGWNTYKRLEKEKLKIFGPGPYKFAGHYPLSEPESKCLYNLTTRIDSRMTLSFHAQGEVIYWQCMGKGLEESEPIAKALSKVSGYLLENEGEEEAYAGYKEWYISHFNKPGFTIEVGLGTNPLDIKQCAEIYEKIEELMLLAAII